MKKQSKQKCLTLVALVITIIILLILAGITILSISRENGLLSKVNQTKKEQIESEIKSEMKDALTLAISKLQLEKEGKAELNDDVTQEWANNTLVDYNVKIIRDILPNEKKVRMKKDNITEKYVIDENLNVKELENDGSIEFLYDILIRTENKVKIVIYVQDEENGLSKIEFPDKNAIIVKSNKEIGIDYEVEVGKEYKIKITSENGQTKEETILITDFDYTWKLSDYPVLTKSGMKNMEFSDQFGNSLEYKKDLAQGGCLAEDALPIDAWDDNRDTCVRTGTYYFKVADEMINNTLVWDLYWWYNRTASFTFCNANKEPIADSWGCDYGGSRTIIENTKYVKYYSNGHFLYEVSGK